MESLATYFVNVTSTGILELTDSLEKCDELHSHIQEEVRTIDINLCRKRCIFSGFRAKQNAVFNTCLSGIFSQVLNNSGPLFPF